VEENLNFYATIFGTTIEENYDLVKDIYSQIEPFKKRLAKNLSGGMKQKLALSCALIHKPTILVLDEPTTGVDAVSRKEFWEMLNRLKQQDITIIVSTPYMDEATLCDRVALIQNGKILSINTPENIINEYNRELLAIRATQTYKLIVDLRNYSKTYSVYSSGQYIHYTEKTNDIVTDDILKYLKEKDHENIEIKSIKPDIEDCFIELMSKD
jgi:ABC-type multidrug transport system ATPase subunit